MYTYKIKKGIATIFLIYFVMICIECLSINFPSDIEKLENIISKNILGFTANILFFFISLFIIIYLFIITKYTKTFFNKFFGGIILAGINVIINFGSSCILMYYKDKVNEIFIFNNMINMLFQFFFIILIYLYLIFMQKIYYKYKKQKN